MSCEFWLENLQLFCKSFSSLSPPLPGIVTLVHKNLHSNFPPFRLPPCAICALKSKPDCSATPKRRLFLFISPFRFLVFLQSSVRISSPHHGQFSAKQGGPGIPLKNEKKHKLVKKIISWDCMCDVYFFIFKYYSSNPLSRWSSLTGGHICDPGTRGRLAPNSRTDGRRDKQFE